jgi:hypothetical protein
MRLTWSNCGIPGCVLMVANMKITVLWNVNPFYQMDTYRRFGGICCLFLRGRRRSCNGNRGYWRRERGKKSGVREGEWEMELPTITRTLTGGERVRGYRPSLTRCRALSFWTSPWSANSLFLAAHYITVQLRLLVGCHGDRDVGLEFKLENMRFCPRS